MAKNEKRVSINTIDKVINEQFESETTERWHDIEIRIKRNLSLAEMLSFVNDVVNSCFQEDGVFVPEVEEFAIASNLISRYTNISLPDNLEHRYAILSNSDLVDFVLGFVDRSQYDNIIQSIDWKLDYMRDTNVLRLNKLVETFEELREKADEMFKGVTQEDINNMMGVIGNIGSNDNIVATYLNQVKPQ